METLIADKDPARFIREDYPTVGQGLRVATREGYLLEFDFWFPANTVWEDIQKGLQVLDGLVMTPPPQGPGHKGFQFVIIREGGGVVAKGGIGFSPQAVGESAVDNMIEGSVSTA